MKYPHILLAVVFFLVLANVHAQDNKYPLVTGDFQGWDLDAFARAIEAGSGVRLYYDPAWSDSICINLSLEAQPLDKVLDRIFQGTSFYYSMDVYGGILVTKGIQLRTDLPEAFTGGKQPALSRKSEVTIDLVIEKPENQVTSENRLYDIGHKTNVIGPGVAIVSGNIRNARTGEPVAGATVYTVTPAISAVTDQYGYFSISLPKGHHILNVQGLGMRDGRYQVVLYSDGKLDIDLLEQVTILRTVIVSAEKTANIRRVQMGL